jgi:Protein of unknown function (DUF4238)
MSNPVKHHYVAQHVLRRFCDSDGILWTYDKQKKQIYRAQPASQASAKHFYSFKGRSGLDSATIELILSRIDQEGSVAIERLLRREKLTGEEGCAFMRFAAAQMIRVDSYFQRIEGMLTPILQESAKRVFKHDEQFRNRLREEIGEKALDQFVAKLERGDVKVTANRGYIVTIFLKSLDSITAEFCRMKWGFLHIRSTNQVFVISDNPLVLADIGEGQGQPLGLRNPDIEVTMPLSRTTVALGRWDEGVGYGTIDTDYIPVINQRTIDQAERYVYAPFRSEELLEQVVASQGRQPRMRVKKIRNGDATIFLSIYSDRN